MSRVMKVFHASGKAADGMKWVPDSWFVRVERAQATAWRLDDRFCHPSK